MGLADPWIKLALIRLARSRTRMTDETKKRLYKWGSTLVRLKSKRWLTPDIIERLLAAELSSWHRILVQLQILKEDSDDPVPQNLVEHYRELDWSFLIAVLRGDSIPGRQGRVSNQTMKDARSEFNDACQDLYWQWLETASWRAPLLVLDEAHHAKNDSTQLAGLLRSEEAQRLVVVASGRPRPLLWDKFHRMLFLTATPFQLGHQELIRVLRSFTAACWTGQSAPDGSRESFETALDDLERRLDSNRLAARSLDRLWGRLTIDSLAADSGEESTSSVVSAWWRRVSSEPREPLEVEIARAVDTCRKTRLKAEVDPVEPWAALRTWVIRHNRPETLPGGPGKPPIHRRQIRPGSAITLPSDAIGFTDRGLSIPEDQALPFLLAARAQGELAAGTAKTRAFFAEGLCSSYEAFHHTRDDRADIRDVNDEGLEQGPARTSFTSSSGLVPISWYESHITNFVPSLQSSGKALGEHPKIRPVVDRVTQLWLTGEKVLVFCFYRQTARALRAHIGAAIERATLLTAGRKLGLDVDREASKIRDWLDRIARRLGDEDSPFHAQIVKQLRDPFTQSEFAILVGRADKLIGLLAAYVRAPTFIARYLPLDVPEVRDALAHREARAQVVRAGVDALSQALREGADGSELTMQDRITEFLRFAKELAEIARHRVVPDGEARGDPLDEYLDALGVYVSSRHSVEDDDQESRQQATGAYRVLPTVRMVYGATKPEVRQRLMLAFNSPLFPEVLISSAVLSEGVDLHRFCRYVVHHDLCWNPSTLEQRTGRVDRIRCKAEVSRKPIVVYEPYLAGSADEKMFRVVRDRERWFQIVMGQKFELDEAASEKLAQRVPLPAELADTLVFDLSRAEASAPPSMAAV